MCHLTDVSVARINRVDIMVWHKVANSRDPAYGGPTYDGWLCDGVVSKLVVTWQSTISSADKACHT